MLDRLIINATVVDGTGAPRRVASVGIRDGVIVGVYEADTAVPEEASEVIDATGLVLTPGFIDPHTHYDAQLMWDPAASPSNLHGITTIMAGNCGFTLAPIKPEDADYTRRMMAKVEGMPLAALEEGVTWDWESFAEYLDRLDGKIAVNAGFLVGHCALRRHVMGADAVGNEATPEQLAAMEDLLRTSIEAGGMGFSTTLSRTHTDGDGEPVASRWASRDELMAFAKVVSEYPGTTLEYASNGCLDGFNDDDVQFMIDFSLTGQRPLNWNVLTVDSNAPERYRTQLEAMDQCREAGAKVVALTMPILVGMNMSFLNFCGLNLIAGWGDILGLPVPERIEKLRDPEVRAYLQERAKSPEAGVFARLAGWEGYVIGQTYSPNNDGLRGKTASQIGAERGISAFDALLDVVIEDELRTVLWPGPTDDDDLSWQMRAEAWEHPSVIIGGSDAGAHLDRMAGPAYTTQWIGDCLRGRKLTTLERAVQHLTEAPAKLFGLKDRGYVREGYAADLVLFDPETVGAGRIELVEDLPGGTARLVPEAKGMKRVIVAGTDIVIDGVATDATPGRVMRSGIHTETVSLNS